MNARFWEFVNGDFVKLCLKPGQSITHSHGGPTEEGYSWESHRWQHVGDGVAMLMQSDARDCDGRISHESAYFAPLFQLHDSPRILPVDGMTGQLHLIAMPLWTEQNSSQRDYSAEAMGY